MRYAKGPDGTLGFHRTRRCVPSPKSIKRSEDRRRQGPTKEEKRSAGLLLSLRFLSFRRQHFLGSILSKFCNSHFHLYVERIDLRGPPITDECATALCGLIPRCVSLKDINLSCQSLGNRALPILQTLPCCPRMQSIRLYASDVGDAGAACLAHVLPHCPRMREIDLRWNGIGDAGMSALANVVPYCGTLARLHLTHNHASEEALEQWARGQRSLGLDVRC